MTQLTITPKVSDKTARFKGTIAAGEHVAVTIKGGAEWLGEDDGANLTLRVIDETTRRTVAVFPRPAETLDDGEEDDAWDSTQDGDLTCTLNLNTVQAVNAARHMLRVPVLFVLGDTDNPRTLYFRDRHEIEYWPERIGDTTPYDLSKWPKQIDDWTELVTEWQGQMSSFGAALSGHTGNGSIHVTAEQKVLWTAKQDAINDLDTIRSGAAAGATAIQEHQDISGKVDRTEILSGGKVKESLLPSYVDDVLEYASASAFPATGEAGKIYVAKNTNATYRWSGTQYVQIGGGGTSVTVDDELSETSENPVQNKVVTAALAGKLTRAEAEAGFTEWTCDPATHNGHELTVSYDSASDEWHILLDGNVASVGLTVVDGVNATSLEWTDGWDGTPETFTATRTRLPTMADLDAKEATTNKATALSASSTDAQYPSAKCVYDELAKIPYDLPAAPITPTAGAPFVLAACFPIVATVDGVQSTISDPSDITLSQYMGGWVLDSDTLGISIAAVDANGKYAGSDFDNGIVISVTFDGDTPDSSTQVLGFTPTYALADRTMNPIVLDTLPENGIALSFPEATAGKVRDFLLRLEIPAGDAPQIAYPSDVKFGNGAGEFPEINTTDTTGATAETILMFTETVPYVANATPAKFFVKGEAWNEIGGAT